MSRLLNDLRYAVRTLARRPGSALIAVLTLGLGIGAGTAIFSVVNGVLIRPLPYPDPERLVYIWNDLSFVDVPRAWVSGPQILDLREGTSGFEGFAGLRSGSAQLTGPGAPEHVQVTLASANLFDLLGVNAARGRTFHAGEDGPEGGGVAVLSHGFWQRRFGSDPGIIGRSITLDGGPVDVVGVMPPDFDFLMHSSLGDPVGADLWLPMTFALDSLARGVFNFAVLARIEAGVTPDQAAAELAALGARQDEEYFGGRGFTFQMVPLHGDLVKQARPALRLLLGAVAFLLLIVCANVAALMLGRIAERTRDLAVRRALGAGAWAILRQLLSESILLAGLGGALGVLFAVWGVPLLLQLAPESLPRQDVIGIDWRVLAFAFAVTAASGIIFGLGPAIQAARAHPAASLREGGRSATEGPTRSRIRAALVVAEIAVSLMLMVGAGLLARSFVSVQRTDPGFQPDGVLTMRIDLPAYRYPDQADYTAFLSQVLQRIEALPAVTAAGATTALPLSALSDQGPIDFAGAPAATGDSERDRMVLDQLRVTPGYFQAMGIPIRQGRAFEWTDRPGAEWAMVVDETLARRFWPNSSPIGAQVDVGGTDVTIVGVAASTYLYELGERDRGQVYFSFAQVPSDDFALAVRATGDVTALARAVEAQVRAVDPNQPVYAVAEMGQLVSAALSGRRFSTALMSGFAWLALAIAAVGLYGVMSNVVARRRHEIGVRMAVGARADSVLGLILSDGLRLVAIGLALGVIGSLAGARLIRGMLYGVEPTDPVTLLGTATLLVLVATLATLVPARRASRVDPMRILRSE